MSKRNLDALVVVLFLVITNDAVAIDVIAHRGYACGATENTVHAVKLAWLAEANGVELDLRVSNDGVVLLYHDEKIGGRLVSNMSYAEIDASFSFKIPKFEDILNIDNPHGYFVLDLKDTNAEKYSSLVSLIEASNIEQNNFVIQSENIKTLANIQEKMPNASYYYLTHLRRTFPFYRAPRLSRIFEMLNGHEFHGVSLKGRKFIDRKFIQGIKDAGYSVNVWTINNPTRASYYRAIGVDGIITDFVTKIRSKVIDGEESDSKCTIGRADVS